MANLKHMNNDMAVSPIVATLVLIVVAVIGAVAVGTIMGTFSSDVSKQANANNAASASSTEILTAGSTTVQPASLILAKSYAKAHPGVKINVQGGGSGAGFAATVADTVDIGAMSEDYKQNTKYVVPAGTDIKQYQIGGSGIVVIAHTGALAANTITVDNLVPIFSDGITAQKFSLSQHVAAASPWTVAPATIAGITEVVTRSDASGTADTFYKTLGFGGQITPAGITGTLAVSPQSENGGVLAEVQKTTGAIGFVDMGYAFPNGGTAPAANIQVLNLDDTAHGYFSRASSGAGVLYEVVDASSNKLTTSKSTSNNLKDSAKNFLNNGKLGTTDYPLSRGLYYLVNGEPSSVVKSFISYAQSPGAQADFKQAGMFSMADLAA